MTEGPYLYFKNKLKLPICNKNSDYIELYRIRDYRLSEPFFLRIFGLCNVTLVTSDKTYAEFPIKAIPANDNFIDIIRPHVEKARQYRNVREVDFE